MGSTYIIPIYRGFLIVGVDGEYVTSIRYTESRLEPLIPEDGPGRLIYRYCMGEMIDLSRLKVRYPYGSLFDHRVWNIVRGVKYGEVKSYRWVAERLGNAKYVRAVGRSLSRNPILIVVPCHRIIRSDGSIGGFRAPGGVGLKMFLLRLEGSI